MMTKFEKYFEIGVSLVIVVLLLLLTNPFYIWMPDQMQMTLVLVLVIAFLLLAIYVVRERVRDEREDKHRLMAGRAAFMVGSTVTLLGIIWQVSQHQLDYWLLYILAAMVLTKLIVRIYGDYNH